MHAVRFGGFVRDAPRPTYRSNLATLTTYCSLLTAHRLLLTAHCFLFTAAMAMLTAAMATLTSQYRQSYHTYHFLLAAQCGYGYAHCGYGYAYQVRDETAFRAARQRQTNLVVSSFKERRALEYATPPYHAISPYHATPLTTRHPLTTLHPLNPRCAAASGTWRTVSPAHVTWLSPQVRGALPAQLAGAQPAPLLARLS